MLQIAYLTPLLHSLKYPAASVNGVLLGKSSRTNDSVKITVVEAIPLLHAHIALSPMMDAAFCILDEYCRCLFLPAILFSWFICFNFRFDLLYCFNSIVPASSRKKGLFVVGYYHANASMDQVGVTPLARRIADRIHETVKDADKAAEACLMLVDNQELEQLALALASRRGDLDECARRSLRQ